MSTYPRRVPTPSASRKRKEMESFHAAMPSPSPSRPLIIAPRSRSPAPVSISSNRLLAGYMAHEYLTKGTLLGQRWDPARADAEPKMAKPSPDQSDGPDPEPTPRSQHPAKGKAHRSYADVASLLKGEGAHIPGIFNPTQLARWIQM